MLSIRPYNPQWFLCIVAIASQGASQYSKCSNQGLSCSVANPTQAFSNFKFESDSRVEWSAGYIGEVRTMSSDLVFSDPNRHPGSAPIVKSMI
jgi:hypothetical protein